MSVVPASIRAMREFGSVSVEPTWSVHHKSRKRIMDQGEVFTQPREVEAMLDLIPDIFQDPTSTFLEPAAGDGNFLVAILERKLSSIQNSKNRCSRQEWELLAIMCVGSIYAVDIDEGNVKEARARMLHLVENYLSNADDVSDNFLGAVQHVLSTNIVQGDTLNPATEIRFIKYRASEDGYLERESFALHEPDLDLFYVPPKNPDPIHYLSLGKEEQKA